VHWHHRRHPRLVWSVQRAEQSRAEAVHSSGATMQRQVGASMQLLVAVLLALLAWMSNGVEARRPPSCQRLSDIYGLSPASPSGTGHAEAESAFTAQRCRTWPSFHTHTNSTAECPGELLMKRNVKSLSQARRLCLKQYAPRCVSYIWSPFAREERTPKGIVALPPNTLSMCSKPLKNYATGIPGAESAQRLRSYFIRRASSTRCDKEDKLAKVVANVTSSTAARSLCDSTKGCVGYVWSGSSKVEAGGAHKFSPNTALLCSSMHASHPMALPGTGFETGLLVKDYMVYENKYGACSPVSQIATRFDVGSSSEARLHCDRYDGSTGPRCVSYVWLKKNGEVRLCGGVPQTALKPQVGTETGWVRPESCGEISNRFGVVYNSTWGVATPAVKSIYSRMNCKTSPSSCQELSDFYGLSAHVSEADVARVPGSIRDLWLRQRCSTSPEGVARDRFKPVYRDLAASVAEINDKIAAVESIIDQGERATKPKQKEEVVKQFQQATQDIAKTVQRLQQ